MSRRDEYDDDDHVAKLLAEEAQSSSRRYAAVGLSALLPKRSTKTAPKPNTRFLNHLVRDVDNHNAALKKKEELESRMRLRQMRDRERDREREDRSGRDEHRSNKRRRINISDDDTRRYRHSSRGESSNSRQNRSTSPEDRKSRDQERYEKSTPHVSKRSRHEDGKTEQREREHRHRHSHKRRRRTSDSPERDPRSHRRHDENDRNHDPRSQSYGKQSQRHRNNSNHDDSSHKPHPQYSKSPPHSPVSASSASTDPLSSFIGPTSEPKPKPQIRGRGAHRRSNRPTIDARFSADYDPALDLHSDPESDVQDGEDWDMALEALRDRTMWRRKQGERMREAGFGEDEIRKWEAGAGAGMLGAEEYKDVREVKWVKKGDAREWDRGKVVQPDDD